MRGHLPETSPYLFSRGDLRNALDTTAFLPALSTRLVGITASERNGGMVPCHRQPAAAFTSLGRAGSQGAGPPIPQGRAGPPADSVWLHSAHGGVENNVCPAGWQRFWGVPPPPVPVGVAEVLLSAEQDTYLEFGMRGTSAGDSVM